MIDILAPLNQEYSLEIPDHPGVLLIWLVWFAILVVLGIRFNKQKFQLNRSNLVWFAALSLSILLLTPFFGLAVGENPGRILGDQPFNHLMFLAAVPWMLAGGLLGVIPGAMLAGVSGLLLAYLDTHNIFTPLIFISISLVYGWHINQSYRTLLFKLLRSPLLAVIFSIMTAFPFVLFSILIIMEGSLALRLAAAFETILSNYFTLAGMVMIGGVVCVVFKRLFRKVWGENSDTRPSPFETSMIARWLAVMVPLFVALWALSTYFTWLVAESKAQEIVVSELTETARQVSGELSLVNEINATLMDEVDFSANRLGVKLLQSMETFTANGLRVKLVTDEGLILFPNEENAQFFEGRTFSTPTYFEESDTDGSQTINYYQPFPEGQWAVILSEPQSTISKMAWETAAPVFVVGFGVIVIVIFGLAISWSPVKKSILQWDSAIDQFHAGNLDIALPERPLSGELNLLSGGIEKLIDSFRAKLENQFDLSAVNKETSGRLDLEGSLDVVMKAALMHNVSAVRIILPWAAATNREGDQTQRFGTGKHARLLMPLDDQVLSRVQESGEFILDNFQAGKTLNLEKGMPFPASLMAYPLATEGKPFGAFWVSYQDLQSPGDEDFAYFKALAKKASLVVSNNYIFNQTTILKERYEKALATMPDAVFLIDQDGKVLYQNLPAEDLSKRLEFREGDDPDTFRLRKTIFSGAINENSTEPVSDEVLLDGGNIYQVMATPLDIGDQGNGRMIVMRDITQEKEDDLKKSEYVTTVSHELRSPLTLIQGYAKILRLTGNLNDQQGDYVDNIIEGAEEMKSLVHNLLNIGRLEGGEPLEFKQVFAGDLIQKVADSMSAQAKQKNILLNVERPNQQTIIEGDTTYLTQALKNLVDNSIKFTKMGGEVVLSILDDGNNVTFSVLDNGAGISPLDQRHVFEKFHRSGSSPDGKQKGSGLGLAIVKSIAEHHSGKVWFESQLGQGSIFYLQIPKNSSMK